ncbi:MAG TPA: glycosyltransferase [Rhizomicrobium sp.]|nr:glycosyltransferase [Rhizomicrobium sp.]
MRILILNTDYPQFLGSLYRDHPGLADATYSEQMAARNDSLFGVSDFYSRNFVAQGHVAKEIHVNNRLLQYAWARENGLTVTSPLAAGGPASPLSSLITQAKRAARPLLGPLVSRMRGPGMPDWEARILDAQVESFRPDVILNQEMTHIDNLTLRRYRDRGIFIMGQNAAIVPESVQFDAYGLMISSLPNLVEWFRRHGVKAELNRLAFEPHVLDLLGPPPARDIDLSFVGSLSPEHTSRITLLEHLARNTPLKVWGAGVERLPKSSPLRACHQGQAWGRDMYEVLRRSRVTLNHHIDLAENWANNMRLYEATGVGAMLLTDRKRNLAEIFEPEKEVAQYDTPEDCAAQIRRYLADEPSRAAIAAAGQAKTLQVHNYAARTAEITALVERYRRP